jgi:Xaa-Pro aminopeptidase
MYYLTKFLAPDPFIFLKIVDTDPIIVVNQMEYSRALKESIVKDVRSYFEYRYLETMRRAKDQTLGTTQFVINVVKKELGSSKICVPHTFPVMTADGLRKKLPNLKPMFGVVEKARETKAVHELMEIQDVQLVTEEVMAETIDLLANTTVGANGTLLTKKRPLTVGTLKSFLRHKLIDYGCVLEEGVIVACGPKGSDPHHSGDSQDILKANQPIILDIFPRSAQQRYWSDMTRTVVRGKASGKVKEMFNAVQEARGTSLDAIHAGASGSDVYNVCCDVLEKAGFKTTRGGKQITNGLTHGLGHGVGLDIHEDPKLTELYTLPLAENNIVTVEPGLYDPKIGGIRIEDVITVTGSGYNNLTKMEICLEL